MQASPQAQSLSKARKRDFLACNPFPYPLTQGFFYREKMRAIHHIAPDQPFKNILEIGGGQGGLTALLYPKAQVTNIDLNPQYALAACNQQKQVRFVCGDATDLPFESQSFDAVTMFDVLEHIPDHEKAVKEALRVLQQGGFLLVSTPNENWRFPYYGFMKSICPNARFDACVLLGQLMRLPVFATFQGGNWQMSRLEKPLRPLTLRACAGLIVPTQTEANRVHTQYGVPPNKLARIFNPLDLGMWNRIARSEVRTALKIPLDAQVVVYHGRIDIHRKGLDILMDAWKQVCRARAGRDLRLLLVGTGSDAEELQRLITTKQLQGILFYSSFHYSSSLG